MKAVKLFGVGLAAMVILGITATSAFALPQVSIALGEAYPAALSFSSTTKATKLSSETEELKGEGLVVEEKATQATSLGTFAANFSKVKKGTEECASGSTKGLVETKGTWHLVFTSLSPLVLGTLFLVSPFEFTCGTTKLKVRGSALSSVHNASGELTALAGNLEGNGIGKPKLSGYYNDAGQTQKAKLETNFGTGFQETAEETGEVTETATEGKMFQINQEEEKSAALEVDTEEKAKGANDEIMRLRNTLGFEIRVTGYAAGAGKGAILTTLSCRQTLLANGQSCLLEQDKETGGTWNWVRV
jgi:hypothetical protein